MANEPKPRSEPLKGGERRRVVLTPDGPILVEGPVEIELADGTMVVSDRFLVALCTCRRSHRYPLCDTSHRCKTRDLRGT